jgi:6-phosphofructokinase 2
MIYAITLSPILNRTIDVEEIIYDDCNQIVEGRSRPEGRGIDVSRVIKEMGGQSIALGFIGGYAGLELEGRLINEGIVCDFIRINDEVRTKTIIYQRKKNLQTLLCTARPEVNSFEIAAFYNKIKEIPADSFVVLGGAIPRGISDNFFAQVTTTLREKGVKVILDADEEVLKRGVNAGPHLIKPNIHEFGRLIGKTVTDLEEVFHEAKPYLNLVEYIVVSAGPRGVAGVSKEGNYLVTPPKVKVRSSIGAGDSLVAGMVFVLSKGGSFEEALALGVACGTASTLNAGGGLCVKEDIEAVKKDVIIKTF